MLEAECRNETDFQDLMLPGAIFPWSILMLLPLYPQRELGGMPSTLFNLAMIKGPVMDADTSAVGLSALP